MKTNLKRILLFSLIVLTLVVLTVVGASAATYADDDTAATAGMGARIGDAGGEYYATLADAVGAATPGDTITVIKAHSLSAALTIDKNLTIEGQGLKITQANTITINNATVVLNNVSLYNVTSGNCILPKGTANVTVNGADTRFENSVNYTICNQATLTINAGTFTQTGTNRVFWQNGGSTNVTTINGGTFTVPSGNTNRMIGFSQGTVNVTNGSFTHNGTGTSSNIFFIEGNSRNNHLNISGGTFTHATTTKTGLTIIEIRGSTNDLTISGGTFVVSGSGNSIARLNQQTTTITGGTFTSAGAGFIFTSNYGTPESPVASIKNATITANGGNAIEVASAYPTTLTSLTVENCEITASGAALAVNKATGSIDIINTTIETSGDAITTTVATGISLTGGSITTTGAAFTLADGAAAMVDGTELNADGESTGTITIAGQNPYADDAAAIADGMVVRIGDEGAAETMYFESLAAAISMAEAGNTITVIAPHTSGAALLAVNATIEGNGHKITATGAITVSATATVNNINLYVNTDADAFIISTAGNLTIDGEDTYIVNASTNLGSYYVFDTQGKLTINDGFFTVEVPEGGTHGNRRLVWANGGASVCAVTINGGTFDGGNNTGDRVLGFNNAVFTINGGEFISHHTNMFFIEGADRNLQFTITGGTFTLKSTASACTIFNVRGTTNDIIISGGTFINEAADGSIAQFNVETVTITGGTFTSAGAALVFTSNSGSPVAPAITIKNATITANGGNAVDITSKYPTAINSLTIENANITATGSALVVAKAVTITTLKDSTLEATGDAVVLSAETSMKVLGNTEITAGADAFKVSGATLLILGGTQTAADNVIDATNGAVLTVLGGTQNVTGAADVFVYDNTCTFSNSVNDAYYATEGYVARVGEEGVVSSYYMTFAEALAAALAQGKELVLIADVTLDTITVDGDLTISGNGTITYEGEASLFAVSGKLTVKGITVNAAAGFIVNLSGEGNATFESGIYTAKSILAMTEGASGELRLNGGNFTTTSTAIDSTSSAIDIYFAGANVSVTGDFYVYWGRVAHTGKIYISDGVLQSTYRAFGGSMKVEMSGGTVKALATNSNSVGFVFWINSTDAANYFKMSGGTIEASVRAVGTSVGAPITITGGTISVTGEHESYGAAIFTDAGTPAVITISGGTIQHLTESAQVLLDIRKGSTINISGGKFIGNTATTVSVLQLQAATANITGGQFIGQKHNEMMIRAYTLTQKDGEVITAVTSATLNIYGGIFECASGYLMRPDSGTAEKPATINVYGGMFVGTGSVTAIVRVGVSASVNDVANIYGGTFVAQKQTTHIFYTANETGGAAANLHAYTAVGGNFVYICGNVANENSFQYPNLHNHVYCYNTIQVEAGASVRALDKSTGIRFTSTVPAGFIELVNGLKKDGTDVAYGTIIVPTDYLEGVSVFSVEALKAAGKKYLDIPATAKGTEEMTDGSLTLRAAMINIKTGNYAREFSAVVYAKYTAVVNGEDVTVVNYSGYLATNNSRSMAEVSRAAYGDLSDTQTGDYIYEIAVEGGVKYSKITAAQRERITAFFDPATSGKEVDIYVIAGQSNGAGYGDFNEAYANSNENFKNGYSNVLYSGGAGTGGTLKVYDLTSVQVGLGCASNRVGAEIGMATIMSDYYENLGKDACIVKWADGGTNLLDVLSGSNDREGNWLPPSFIEQYGANDVDRSGQQYRDLIAMMENAISNLKRAGYTKINIKGAFWMQGCAERALSSLTFQGEDLTFDGIGTAAFPLLSFDESVPYSYPNVFKMLVEDMRADFGEMIGEDLSNMPVVVGQISEAFQRNHNDYETLFVQMQADLANWDQLDHIYTVNSGVLGTGYSDDDAAHFTCNDMEWIGQQVAACFLNHNYDANIDANTNDTIVAEVYDSTGAMLGSYDHLAYAINTCPAGGRVEVKADVTLHSELNIINTNKITVNGNGHTLTSYSDDKVMRLIKCDVTFNDYNVTYAGTTVGAYLTYCYESTKLTINGGHWQGYGWGLVMNGVAGIELTVDGAEFTVSNPSTVNYSCITTTSAGAKITVTDSVFNIGGSKGSAINIQSGAGNTAVVNISGITVNGNGTCQGVRDQIGGIVVVDTDSCVFNNCAENSEVVVVG